MHSLSRADIHDPGVLQALLGSVTCLHCTQTLPLNRQTKSGLCVNLQVQIYTWPDATLRELTDLVKEVQPAARRTTARLEFALIYPDKKGRNVIRVIGGTHSNRPGPDDIKTLKQLNFQVSPRSVAAPAALKSHSSRALPGGLLVLQLYI